MKDGTRELTNNQWLLKADADKLPTTYAELVTLLTGAGLPFGRTLLSDGWTIEPDPLNKANLLKDATAALYGLTSAAMMDDAFKKAAPKKLLQSYTTAGTFTWTAPDRNGDGTPYEIGVVIVGGGGSGAAFKAWATGNQEGQAAGGGSGYSKQIKATVTPGSSHTVAVGAGGASVTVGSGTISGIADGVAGNSSSFSGVVANGGFGGAQYASYTTGLLPPTKGGRPADAPTILYNLLLYVGTFPAYGDRSLPEPDGVPSGAVFSPSDCINKFTGEVLLAAGGSASISNSTTYNTIFAQNGQLVVTGALTLGAAVKSFNNPVNVACPNPTLYGAGGGACVNCGTTSNTVITAQSGKGADGCILIYG